MNRGLIFVLAGLLACALLGLGISQETPTGGVTVKLQDSATGKPITGVRVTASLIGEQDESEGKPRVFKADKLGQCAFRGLPVGEYEIEVRATNHSVKPRKIFVEEGEVQELTLALAASDPYLKSYASQRVFRPQDQPKVELHGFATGDYYRFRLFNVAPDRVAKEEGLFNAFRQYKAPNSDLRALGPVVLDESRKIEHRDGEGTFTESLELPTQPEGIFCLVIDSGKNRDLFCLNVTNLALVVKSDAYHVLCYVTDLTTGVPIGGAQILASTSRATHPVGSTDKNGLLAVPSFGKRMGTVRTVMVRNGKSFGLVEYEAQSDQEDKGTMILYCDRPAYRPGDTVYFKGIIRQRQPTRYVLPNSRTVKVNVTDPDQQPVLKTTLVVNSHGTFNGSFQTEKDGGVGGYRIQCDTGAGIAGEIDATIFAYRKPQFTIDVKPAKPLYTMGDTAQATVDCRYFFGSPMAGVKVTATIYRSQTYNDDTDGSEAIRGPQGGEYSEKIEAQTDATGRAILDFPTRADKDPDNFSGDFVYDINVTVSEDGQNTQSANGSVKVARGDYRLKLLVENPILTVGSTAKLRVKTQNIFNHDEPASNKSVTIVAGKELWTRRTSVFQPIQSYQVVTNSLGEALLEIPVKEAESLVFRATGMDSRQREIRGETSAYVEGSSEDYLPQKDELTLTLEKKALKSGESAKALIRTTNPGGYALVTVEGTELCYQQVVYLAQRSTIAYVPINKSMAPNADVHVTYVKGLQFITSEAPIEVDKVDQELKVSVKAESPNYRPGDRVRLHVETATKLGQAKAAEVSLAVVDESIFAVAGEPSIFTSEFEIRTYNHVQTRYSFAPIYLDGGDKGSSKVKLRKNFKDTAAWFPGVWTGEDGKADVEFDLPDNLTQWRATVVGVSDDSYCGLGNVRFRARKELMARFVLPQFMVKGDALTASLVVTNDAGHDLDAHLEVSAQGTTLDRTQLPTMIHVAQGKSVVVDCPLRADEVGQAQLTAKVWTSDGSLSDGVQQNLTINPFGVLVDAFASGQCTGQSSRKVEFDLPAKSDPNFGTLEVQLSPTLVAGLVQTLDGFIDYPYGCTEQTMNRFLPSVLVEHSLTRLRIAKTPRMATLPSVVRQSIRRLNNMHHPDGGWGWWESDDSNPFMTALVLDGLDKAKRVGWKLGDVGTDRAVEWGQKNLGERKGLGYDLAGRLYLAYALGNYGVKNAVDRVKIPELKDLNATESALAALAFHRAAKDKEANACLDRLVEKHEGIETAFWPTDPSFFGQETTAIALMAFSEVRPDDPLVPKIIRYLYGVRKGQFWTTTRDSSFAIQGLVGYIERTESASTRSSVSVIVNGETVNTVQMETTQAANPDWTVRIPRNKLTNAHVTVEVKANGGQCYFQARLAALNIQEPLVSQTTDPGFTIERTYHRLSPRADKDGIMRLLPSAEAVTRFSPGELIRVVLKIHSRIPQNYLLLEEPLPSNCHPETSEDLGENEGSGDWWPHTSLKDDRLALFVEDLQKGDNTVTYTMRAEQRGSVRVLPTRFSLMYDPAVFSSSSEGNLDVKL